MKSTFYCIFTSEPSELTLTVGRAVTEFAQSSYVVIVSVFKIVGNINQAQDPDNYSFSLFTICNSIAAYLYLPKMKRVGNVMTYMTISGEGFSTGKSLCTDICMTALYGEKLDCTAPTTIPKLYEMLASGTPIVGKTG